MGHVLNIDWFRMSEPTFPPHPHAGFSAVTWMLPWSEGSFTNRDSRGDRSRIVPGSLHWTLAGSGVLHEEIPERPGVACEGLQIFVKLPERREAMAPRSFHLAPDELPTRELPGATARVLVGEFGGLSSPIPSYAGITMLHVDVHGALELAIPDAVEAFVIVLRGVGTIDGRASEPEVARSLTPGWTHRIAGRSLAMLVAWSESLPSMPFFVGPLCMFKGERLTAAQAAYARGEMGQLTPSDVRWVR